MSSRRALGKLNQKVTKQDKVAKGENIREQLQQYDRIYVLKFSSEKTEPQTELRKRFRSSNLCLAKKTIVAHAIGNTPETEVRPGMSQLLQYAKGSTGIFMTNESDKDVREYLASVQEPDFANAGFIATEDFVVPEGPLPQFSFSQDGFLRELGLPVKLDNGVIVCIRNHEVCHAGQELTKNQAGVLKQFGVKMDTYRIEPIALWENGSVKAE